jgi:GTP pyrophosphokinase
MVENFEDLLLEIGKGIISQKTVVSKMLGLEVDKELLLQRQMEKANRQLTTHSETGVVIEGLTSPQIKLANCCSPVPGDQIKGYVSKHGGIVIHTLFCPNYTQLEENRLIDAFWSSNITRKYAAWLKIVGSNKPNLLSDVVSTVNANNISIAEVNAITNANLEMTIKIKVSVSNYSTLQNLVLNIRKITEIYSVERAVK